MFFGFTDDQLAFRNVVRDLFADACPPSAVRAAWTEGPGYDPKLWQQLGEMGVLDMLAPTDAGGLGLDEVDLVLILEESGRVAFPGPLVEHAAVAVPALAAAGRPIGEAVATFADRPDRVGWAAQADVVMLATDHELALCTPGDLQPIRSVDRSRRDAAMSSFSAARIDGDADRARDRAALGTAAQLCGLADRMIGMTVEYAKGRRQFGVAIGSYQAVKHHLANALLRLEHARPAVYRAAHSLATSAPTQARDVSMAKVMAGDAAALAGRVALQCHGAIGYTWEHDLHLWLKRVWVLERAFGTTAAHRRRVAAKVIDDAQS